MKKLYLFVLFPIFVFLFLPYNFASAEESKTYYAKVEATGVQFCSAPTETSVLFELPYSYFVKVDYVVDDFFKVEYKDVEGYVKKDKVTLMNGLPNQPYASSQFSLFVPFSLYTDAHSSSEAQMELTNKMTLDFYGTKTGEEYSYNNNIWYYCSTKNEGETHFGYVFSQAQYLNPQNSIGVNNETFEVVSESVLLPKSKTFSGLSTGTKILLIVAISVPSVIILYFLIKPSKIMQITKTKRKTKQEKHKIQHGDYFEFDESQIS